jgi:hypothetical protein
VLIGAAATVALQRAIVFFLKTTFSFRGAGANVYAAVLALAVVVFASSIMCALEHKDYGEYSWSAGAIRARSRRRAGPLRRLNPDRCAVM